MAGQWSLISKLAATNLVKNPAFASWSGTVPDNWTINTASPALAKSTSVVFTGLQAVKITGYNFIYQDIPVGAAGTQYRASAWVFALAGAANSIQLAFQNTDYSQQIIASVPVSAYGTWYRLEATHTSPSGNMLKIALVAASGAVAIFGAVQLEALDTTNYLLNPSFEQWTSATQPLSWIVNGVGANQTTSPVYDGVNSLKISGSGTTVAQTVSNLPLGASVTLTAWVQGSGTLECDVYDGLAATNPASVGTALTGTWQQVTLNKTVVDGGIYLQFKINNGADYAYIDGVNLSLTGAIASESATTYIDGGQPDCAWNGTPYLSTSSRPATTTQGGAIFNLDKFGAKVSFIDGAGMPPMENVSIDYAVLDGAQFQRQRAKARPFSLKFKMRGKNWQDLQLKRKWLIDVLKSDRVPTQQPIMIRYTGGTRPLYLTAVYDGGMEMHKGAGPWVEDITLKFTAYDNVYWTGEGNSAVQVLSTATATANNCALRTAGSWSVMPTGGTNGTNGVILCSLQDPVTGYIWVGGKFTLAGNLAAANIAYFDPATGLWHAVGAGITGAVALQGPYVRALARDANGNIFAGGTFTTGGATACANITKIDTSFNYSALGSGVNGDVYALQFDSVGNLFIGGNFSTAGGATVNGICYWTGSAYVSLGTGVNGSVNGLAYVPKAGTTYGKLIAGGYFTSFNGTACNNIVTYDIATGATNTMNGGLTTRSTAYGFGGSSAQIYTIAVGPNGVIYVGGEVAFGNTSSQVFNGVAQWNGNVWQSVGVGLTPVTAGTDTNWRVQTLAIGPDGTLYAGGSFGSTNGGSTGTAGSRALYCLARYNGYDWRPVDLQLPSNSTTSLGYQINTIIANNSNGGTFFVGGQFQAQTVTISTSIAINHPGTANSNLLIRFIGPGVLRTLTNYTTGAVLHFNDYQLLSGETCILLLKRDSYTFTTSFPRSATSSIISAIAGSNFTSFKLAPGTNVIGVYIVNPTAGVTQVQAQWAEYYWSIDGSV